jgi:hypothetical protein
MESICYVALIGHYITGLFVVECPCFNPKCCNCERGENNHPSYLLSAFVYALCIVRGDKTEYMGKHGGPWI